LADSDRHLRRLVILQAFRDFCSSQIEQRQEVVDWILDDGAFAAACEAAKVDTDQVRAVFVSMSRIQVKQRRAYLSVIQQILEI